MSEPRFFNTLTRRQEPFTPLVPGEVRIYCCGPTVYSYVHIGNLRTFLWNDLLRRYLLWKGYRVTQVMNLTDVEDKIIRKAGESGVDIYTYTQPYIDAFFEDIDTLRIRRADLYPKATDHVAEMLDIVDRLAANGHTYVAEGSTYFRIATLPGYGRLSQIELAETSAFSRVESDEYGKEDARDFVLWKAKKEGEPSWEAAIGEGRPGWHLECSAMSIKYLGETFDIHTGAVDLIFPHHENEIAQSEGATGREFVRYWLHGEHLNVDQQKMSKSLGNIYTLRELLAEGYDPLAIRYALLSVPYRTKLNFTLRSLEDASAALDRLDNLLVRLREVEAGEITASEADQIADDLAKRYLAAFEEALDDDLNTAAALGALFTLVRDTNIAIDEGKITASGAAIVRAAIEHTDSVLDIRKSAPPLLDGDVEAMIEARNQARRERNFKESDRLRDELLARGIILEDTPGGTRWRRK